MKAALKSYTIACLAVFVAAAQIAIMASVTSATVARADAAGGDTLMTLTPPEREPAAVWVGGTAAGLRVARVDDRRLVVTGSPYRIELRLPAKARRQTVGLAAARTALDALGAPYPGGSVGGRGPSGFDWPMTIATLQRGLIAPLDHHFVPLMTKSSPSMSMRVEMLRASEDATAGSVMP